MRQSPKQMIRWAAILLVLISLSLFSARCATVPSSRKYVGPISDSKTSAPAEESFLSLWEKRTISLDPAKGVGAPGLLSLPLGITGSQSGFPADFPLQIAATLMDTQLIEAGLEHYETVLAMTPEEKAGFRRAYYDRYDPANHILIWCELQTTWAELHLDPDRWVIFIEDDALNRYEPVSVAEASAGSRRSMAEYILPTPQSEPRPPRWEFHQKTLMLLFPKRDFLEKPVLAPGLKFLKLVFQWESDQNTTAEGKWVFRR